MGLARLFSNRIGLAAVVVLAGTLGLTGAKAAPTRAAADPAILFTKPAAGGDVKGVLSLAGTAQAAAGISKVELRVDERTYRPVVGTSSWTLSLDTGAYPDGAHTLKARVTDTTGKQAWADLAIVIQNAAPGSVAPRIAVASPRERAKVTKSTIVRGTAGAALGLASVELRVDDGPYRPAIGLSAWWFGIDTGAEADGKHSVTVRATDLAGTQVTARRSFVVANHAGQIYWGALISGRLYGYGNPPWDMRSLKRFEEHAGKTVSLLALGANWGAPHPEFPTALMQKVRDHGSIPFYSWASMSPVATNESAANQPKYSL